MTLERIRRFFGVCTLLNYAVLLVWSAAYLFGHDAFYRIHSSLFPISREAFDIANYAGIGLYKLGVLLFFLFPYIALRFFDSKD